MPKQHEAFNLSMAHESPLWDAQNLERWLHGKDDLGSSELEEWLRSRELGGLPPLVLIEEFFQFLDGRAPGLKAPCRWLLLGPALSNAILLRHAREPKRDELKRLDRLLKKEAARLVPLGAWLIARLSPQDLARAQRAVRQVKLLVSAPRPWSHPSQIVQPSADISTLLEECQLRLDFESVPETRARLSSVLKKLKRVEALEQKATERAAGGRRKS